MRLTLLFQVKLSEGRERYTFYDGPPFATGLPYVSINEPVRARAPLTRHAVTMATCSPPLSKTLSHVTGP